MSGKLMYRMVFAFVVVYATALPGRAQQSDTQAAAFNYLSYYIDLIQSGNLESAIGFWEPSALARAERLGIRYEGIPIKADCNSPVIYDYERSRGALSPGIQSVKVIDEGIIRYKLAAKVCTGVADYFYHLQKAGDYIWIIYPQDYYARDWPVSQSKYFRFHISPKMANDCHQVAINALDDFVDSTAARIGISPERLTLLADKKIDYYVCNGEFEVSELSGAGKPGKGYYDMGADAVVTSIFPHFHEIAHLLVNFKLQILPPFTASFMQEGSAVYLGGRWQRSPAVMIDFGKYILDNGVTEIDSVLLENDSSLGTGADVSFPVGACLTEYLFSKLGADRYFELYRALSGNYLFYSNLQPDSVKRIVTSIVGLDWPLFKTDFSKYLDSTSTIKGRIYPGDIATNRTIINDSGLVISASDRWLKVEYTPQASDKVDIGFLFAPTSALEGKHSTIYSEQYRNSVPFKGYRYGIRLDKNEIGLYDYGTNQLVAKYVYDFNPSPKYFDKNKGKYTAYFNIALLGKNLPDKSNYALIRQSY